VDSLDSQSALTDTLRGRLSRRQVLKGGAAVGAAAVWAVPVVEVLTTASASASGLPTTTTKPPSTNLSWVDLIFVVPPATEDGAPTFYVWSSTTNSFQKNTDGFGNIGSSAFSSFDFYSAVTAGQADFTDFTTMPTGYSISSSLDTAGNLSFTASGTPPTGLKLADVLVHGGANAYDGSGGSAVVAYGGTGGPDTAKAPVALDVAVPTGAGTPSNLSGTVANSMQTVTIDGTTYDMSFLVGTT